MVLDGKMLFYKSRYHQTAFRSTSNLGDKNVEIIGTEKEYVRKKGLRIEIEVQKEKGGKE
jgi:hypothetical protein